MCQVSQQASADLSRSKPALLRAALPASLSVPSFSFTPAACPGQYTHRRFRRWTVSTIDTFHSGLPILLFTFCSKLVESVRMIACHVWSDCHLLRQSSGGDG